MNNIELPSDIEASINGALLVTGAGFSKGFGGLLTHEIWPFIYNHTNANDNIKKSMQLNHGNYEDIYTEISETDKDIFGVMDGNIKQNINGVGDFNKFISLFHLEDAYNFVITTNQDLIFERYFLNNRQENKTEYITVDDIKSHLSEIIKLHFPYIDYSIVSIVNSRYNGCPQQQKQYQYNDFVQNIAIKKDNFPKIGYVNYIKLHGSFNWNHSEGHVIQITGKNKSSTAKNTKILESGLDAFKQIICKVKKIVIIGYGFNDPHINDRLFEAVQQKIPLIIINPSPWNEFKSNKFIFEEYEKDSISNSNVMFEAIAKYYEREFNEFLSSEILSVDQFSNFKNFLTS